MVVLMPMIFGKELRDYVKVTWRQVLAVAIIGVLQVVLVYVVPIERSFPFDFLQATQLVWALIVAVTAYNVVGKRDFSVLQGVFVGFLFFVAFGVVKVVFRLGLGHDEGYLFFGDAERMSPLFESFLYISLMTAAGVVGGVLEKKEHLK